MAGAIRRRRGASVVLAICLTAALGGQALGASWAYPIPLTASHDAAALGVVALEPSTVLVLFQSSDGDWLVRSTDNGTTWQPAMPAPGSRHTAIAAYGTAVDLVSVEGSRVRYQRSIDAGLTFKPRVTLSGASASPWSAAVARGPDNRVAVAWSELYAGVSRIRVRVSTNGGKSFAAAKTIASNGASSAGVAIGQGVIYVNYRDADGLRIRRSINSGSTWGTGKLVAADAYGDPGYRSSMSAQGSRAYLAYVAVQGAGPNPHWVRYVKSSDKGRTWSAPRNLSPGPGASYLTSDAPAIVLDDGVARVAFRRCLEPGCGTSGIFYRQSTGGTKWSDAYAVSIPVDTPYSYDPSLASGERVIAAFTGASPAETDVYVRVRTP